MTFSGEWSRRSFQPYRQAPSVGLDDPTVRLVDLDGDGLTDVLRSGSRLECWFNDPDPRRAWQRTAVTNGPVSDSRSHRSARSAGRHDRRRAAGHRADPQRQHRLLAQPRVTGGSGRRSRCAAHRACPTGMTRVACCSATSTETAWPTWSTSTAGRVQLWGNQSGNAWSRPAGGCLRHPGRRGHRRCSARRPARHRDGRRAVEPTRPTARTRLRCDSSISPAATSPTCSMRWITTSAHGRPGDATSRRRSVLSARPGDPATRWRTTLPFPVHVVARVEVHDADLVRPADHRVPLPPRLLGRRRAGVPRVRDGRATRHGDLPRGQRSGTGLALLAADADQDAGSTPGRSPPSRRATGPSWTSATSTGRATRRCWAARPRRPRCWPRCPRRLRRDALRALRGQVLRTELYALDGTDREDRPYTVTESLSAVREESPPPAGAGAPAADLLPVRPRPAHHPVGTRRRADDPVHLHRPSPTSTGCDRAARRRRAARPRPVAADQRRPSRTWPRTRPPSTPAATTPSATRRPGRPDDHARGRQRRPAERGRPARRRPRRRLAGSRRLAAGDRAHAAPSTTGRRSSGCRSAQLGEHGLAGAHRVPGVHRRLPGRAVRRRRSARGRARPSTWLRAGSDRLGRRSTRSEFRDAAARRWPATCTTATTTCPGRRAATTSITARHRYDVHDSERQVPRGLPLASLDPLGAQSRIDYDEHDLLPVRPRPTRPGWRPCAPTTTTGPAARAR